MKKRALSVSVLGGWIGVVLLVWGPLAMAMHPVPEVDRIQRDLTNLSSVVHGYLEQGSVAQQKRSKKVVRVVGRDLRRIRNRLNRRDKSHYRAALNAWKSTALMVDGLLRMRGTHEAAAIERLMSPVSKRLVTLHVALEGIKGPLLSKPKPKPKPKLAPKPVPKAKPVSVNPIITPAPKPKAAPKPVIAPKPAAVPVLAVPVPVAKMQTEKLVTAVAPKSAPVIRAAPPKPTVTHTKKEPDSGSFYMVIGVGIVVLIGAGIFMMKWVGGSKKPAPKRSVQAGTRPKGRAASARPVMKKAQTKHQGGRSPSGKSPRPMQQGKSARPVASQATPKARQPEKKVAEETSSSKLLQNEEDKVAREREEARKRIEERQRRLKEARRRLMEDSDD